MHPVASHTPAFISALEPLIHNYGYFAVGGLITLEDFGVPVPGETTLIAAAFFAGTGQLNILLVYLVGFIAAVVGDNIGFAIGKFGGHALVERAGKYVFLTTARLDRATSFFARYGARIVIVARFIEGLRQLNGIIAGVSAMAWRRFIFANAIGAALWVGVWASLGYFGGSHIDAFRRYEVGISIGFGVLIVAYIAYRVTHRLRNRRA